MKKRLAKTTRPDRLENRIEALEARLSAARQAQAATAEVLRAIGSAPHDLNATLTLLVKSAALLCNCDHAAIYLREGTALRAGAFFGATREEERGAFAECLSIDRRTISGRVMLSGQVEVIEDVTHDPDYCYAPLQKSSPARALIGVPLLRQGQAQGALSVASPHPAHFTADHSALLLVFAEQAVIAIENARLFAESEAHARKLGEALRQQTATAEVLRTISRSAFDLPAVLNTLVASAAGLCDARFGGIFLRDMDNTLRGYASLSEREDFWERDSPLPIDRHTVSGRVVLSGKTEYAPDVEADEEYEKSQLRRVTDSRAILGVPLLKAGRVAGVFFLGRREPASFTERHRELLETFADQAMIAIENVRLFEDARLRSAELQESLDYQTATSEVLGVISRSPNELQPVLDIIVRTGRRLCQADRAMIMKLEGGHFHRVAQDGLSVPEFDRLFEDVQIAPGRGSMVGRVSIEKKVIQIEDVQVDADYTVFKGQENDPRRTMLGVPLLKNGHVLGVIVMSRAVVQAFTQRQIDLVATFADQAVIALHNVGLFEEVQRRNRELTESLERQTATSTILKAIAGSPTDVQPVLDAVAESAARLCRAFDSIIFLKQDDDLAWKAHYGGIPMDFISRPIGRDWVTGRALLEGKPIHIEDVSLAGDEFPLSQSDAVRLGNRTLLAVPMLREGEAIGVIVIRRLQVQAFTEAQIELLTTFADQAVIAIENTRLFEEVRSRNHDLTEALDQQTATAEVLRAIAASPTDVQPVLEVVTKSAAELCEAYDAILFLSDGDKLLVRAHHGPIPVTYQVMPIDRGLVSGRAFLDGKPVQVDDTLHAGDDFGISRSYALMQGQRTVLAVPLLRQGKSIGAIAIRRQEVKPFADRQIELLTTFADQAVIAIENARLFEEVQTRTKELSEALLQQMATAEVLKSISSSAFDLDTVLGTLLRSAAELCRAPNGYIFLRDGDVFRPALQIGHTPEIHEFLKENPIRPDRTSVTGRVALSGEIVHLPDVLEDPDYALAPGRRAGGYRTALGVPLLRDGRVTGVFTLGRPEVLPFGSREIDLVQTFADQAVIAVENARLFEEVKTRNVELTETLDAKTATSAILRAIATSPTDIEPVLNAVVESAARLCNAYDAVLFLHEGNSLILKAHHGPIPINPIQGRRSISRNWVSGRVFLDAKLQHVEDLQDSEEFPRGRELARQGGYRTVLSVPLLREGKALGAISMRRLEAQPFNQKQIDLLTTFADQAVIAIENARLFEEVQARTRELQETLDHQTATTDVLNVISRSPTAVEPVLDTIVKTASRLCDAEFALIFRLHGGEYHVVAASNAESSLIKHATENPILPIRGTVVGRAALERRTIHVPDVMADPEYTFYDYQSVGSYRSVLGVPLLREDEAIGVIGLMRAAVKPYSDKQIELVTTFADQAVIAIENARLFEELQARTREVSEALQQQTATAEVLKSISNAAFDLDTVLQTLVKSAAELCHATHGLIALPDGDTFRPVQSVGFSDDFIAFMRSNPVHAGQGSITGRVLESGRVVQIEDVTADPDYTYGGRDIDDYRTLLGVPLLRNEAVRGVFALTRLVVQPFTQREIELVQTFADQAVIAIENVRLFDEVQARTQELARSVNELRVLSEVSEAVNSSLDLKTVLETIVAKAVQLSDTDAGAIYVYDKSADLLRLRATFGMSDELIAAISQQPISLADLGPGYDVQRGHPMQTTDLLAAAPTPAKKIVRDAGFRSLLTVPMLRAGKVMGALVVRRRRPGAFAESTVQLMVTFAAQSVVAIQNARLFREIEDKGHQLEIASRHKSQFLANMSHELRTPLNSVLGFTEMLVDGLYGDLPEKARTALTRIETNGKHLLGLINDVLDLSKIEAGQLQLTFDDYAPSQIVRSAVMVAEPLARSKGLALAVKLAEAMPTAHGDERRLTQVLINLIGNAVKFTEAGAVDVVAFVADGRLEVSVSDTGPGIAPEHQVRIFEEFQQVDDSNTRKKGGSGLGLAIAKRIIEMHDGTIRLRSTPGVGSTFMVSLPLRVGQHVEVS